MSGVDQLMQAGPVLLALPVAVAAGAVTFLSPCVLPLVPGYLSYLTGLSGSAVPDPEADAEPPPGPDRPAGRRQDGSGTAAAAPAGRRPAGSAQATGTGVAALVPSRPPQADPGPHPSGRRRVLAGAALFILGFSALFAIYGTAFGSLGATLVAHQLGLTRLLGALVILLGLLFAGAFDRFGIAGRTLKLAVRPRAGLAAAPLLGVLFGLGWTPCIGPTLGAVLTLALSAGTAARGALLAFAYALGIGIPFLGVALAFDRAMRLLRIARAHARLIARIGGLMLVTVGVLEVTGAWTAAMTWLQLHLVFGYNSPL